MNTKQAVEKIRLSVAGSGTGWAREYRWASRAEMTAARRVAQEAEFAQRKLDLAKRMSDKRQQRSAINAGEIYSKCKRGVL